MAAETTESKQKQNQTPENKKRKGKKRKHKKGKKTMSLRNLLRESSEAESDFLDS